MKQTVGIRFSEHGQVLVCAYEVPEGAPPLAPATGVMVSGEHGLTFGRVAWQHMRLAPDQDGQPPCAAPNGDAALEDTVPPFCAPVQDESPTQHGERETSENEEFPADDADMPAPCASHRKNPPCHDPGQDEFNPPLRPGGPIPLVRPATEEELVIAVENERLNREARVYCRRCIAERQMDMKLVDVETLFDRSKMIFYFTAPTRIDFRELVKDLVRQYRTRIELRQIGVRHETQMLGALGNCGMVCCCRRYLRKFAPVTIKMAKEQNLFLNPAKISGICGRLLCCLSYEQENYDAFHRSCPKLGKRYQTDSGPMRVLRGNMFRNTVITLPDGGQEAEFTLDEWKALNPHRSETLAGQTPRENRPAQDFMVVSAAPDTLDADLADLDPGRNKTEPDGDQAGCGRSHPHAPSQDRPPRSAALHEAARETPPPSEAETSGDSRARRRKRRRPGIDRQEP